MRPLIRYVRLTARPGAILTALAQLPPDPAGVCAPFGLDALNELDAARPGYGRMAGHYMRSGHVGFCVRCEGRLAALAWIFHNPGRRLRRVGYYPLRPEHVWAHATWTHPAYRGRGLHTLLLRARAAFVLERLGDVPLEVNIEPTNAASLRNVRKAGFEVAGGVVSVGIGSRRWAWLTNVEA